MSTTLTPNKPLQVTPIEFEEMPVDRRVRFTVEQYEQLMRAGFLLEGSPIELLDGQLYWKDRRDRGSPNMTIGRRHRLAVMALYAWLSKACEGRGCYPMSQQPISLSELNEPEPDGAVVVGDVNDQFRRHPEPHSLLLVVEVSDSSLDRDLGDKYRLYASMGITNYWVINLADDTVEVYEQPDPHGVGEYVERMILHQGESLSLTFPDGTKASTPVESLLP